ncbi:MAG TPA: tetratricopeptide repeat protein [Terriglobales bacterium]|nr:tetratricopeptide repeat protein [Terriglobales bacterium]
MNSRYCLPLTVVLLLASTGYAQIDRIVIPAGTPEDQSIQEISKETDSQKKVVLYQDFLEKYSSNPAAVAYGNWQISQAYQSGGDLPKALEFGDKALVASPHNFDSLVSQAGIAQQLKDDSKIIDYAERGGLAYEGIGKQAKPEGLSDEEFANRNLSEKDSLKSSRDFLESVGFNAIADEKDAKKRMSYVERFTAAFPSSQFQEQVSQYAMYTLGPGQLNDPVRLVAFGEKSLAVNPNSMPALLMLANTYVEETKPASWAKAVTYSQKVITLAKENEPDADRTRKLSAGVAHSTLGYAYMKQDKTASAIAELKSASALLKGQDEVAYATALYRLGYAYAKLSKTTDARQTLGEAVKISGPLQQPSQELLEKVNAARAKGK